MACRTCGGVSRHDPMARRVGSVMPDPGNIYELQAFEPCEGGRWTGPDFDVYIVGRGLTSEKAFHSSLLDEARQYVREATGNPHLFATSASMLCAEAAQSLLDALEA